MLNDDKNFLRQTLVLGCFDNMELTAIPSSHKEKIIAR